MNQAFISKMNRAQVMKNIEPARSDYWTGYMRGLRRQHHGDKFGTDDEHERWLNACGDESRDQRSAGYRDGLGAVVI